MRKLIRAECDKGHIWYASYNKIKQGRWCPYCAGKAKKTIEEMKQIARNKGGKCLSDKYINGITPLQWQCNKGHLWEAPYERIQIGRWCPDPICINERRQKTKFLKLNK